MFVLVTWDHASSKGIVVDVRLIHIALLRVNKGLNMASVFGCGIE
jgi:hypothetical protein